MDWFSELDAYDIAMLGNEVLLLLLVIIIIYVSSNRKDNLKQRSLMMSRLMISQSLCTAILIFLGSIRVTPSKMGVVAYWSLRSSSLDCNVEYMARHNVGLPIFLFLTGIICNLGAYATWRTDYMKKKSSFRICREYYRVPCCSSSCGYIVVS